MIEIDELRFLAAKRAGISGFTGVLADLQPNDREALIDAMAQIVTENPNEFDARFRDFAAKRIASPNFGKPLDEFTLGEAVSTFTDEFSKQARDVVTLQLGTLKTALFLAALGFGVFAASKLL